MLSNSLNLKEDNNLIKSSSYKTSICILVTNYNHYHGIKPKDYEELILNLRLIK